MGLLLFDYAWGDHTALGIFLGPEPRNRVNYPDIAASGNVLYTQEQLKRPRR